MLADPTAHFPDNLSRIYQELPVEPVDLVGPTDLMTIPQVCGALFSWQLLLSSLVRPGC